MTWQKFVHCGLIFAAVLVGVFLCSLSRDVQAAEICQKRGCYQSQYFGETCVYYPCNGFPDDVKICDDRGCGSGTARPSDYPASNPGDGPIGGLCAGCSKNHCDVAQWIVRTNHENYERATMKTVSEEMRKHRVWLFETFFRGEILNALTRFSRQMGAVAMHQVMAIGMFMDAEQQLDTQLLMQELQIQAHKDYTPSEDFCVFGTNVRSLTASDKKGDFNVAALGAMQMSRHLGTAHTGSAESVTADKAARWQKFTRTYCDPKDNNWTGPGTGLELACPGVEVGERTNIDVDYTRLLEEPRTLEIDFTNDSTADEEDEEDVWALGNNLFGHDVLTRDLDRDFMTSSRHDHLYLDLRAAAAMRSVGQGCFNRIVGLKARGNEGLTGEPNTKEYLSRILEELGVDSDEVDQLIGENPSYYAQLELLAKKIYQNPDFYASQYDKPVNVERKIVAMQAIERMIDHEIMESRLCQESVMAALLSSQLRDPYRAVNRNLPKQRE